MDVTGRYWIIDFGMALDFHRLDDLGNFVISSNPKNQRVLLGSWCQVAKAFEVVAKAFEVVAKAFEETKWLIASMYRLQDGMLNLQKRLRGLPRRYLLEFAYLIRTLPVAALRYFKEWTVSLKKAFTNTNVDEWTVSLKKVLTNTNV